MYEKIEGEYGSSVVWRDRPEPARFDAEADRILLADLLKKNKWTVETLDLAIGTYGHPKPVASQRTGEHGRTPIYSREQIGVWRERITANLKLLGFVAK